LSVLVAQVKPEVVIEETLAQTLNLHQLLLLEVVEVVVALLEPTKGLVAQEVLGVVLVLRMVVMF
jgi:hypothetical protein